MSTWQPNTKTTFIERAFALILRFTWLFAALIVPIKFAWDWIVPELAPGAVSQGLVSATISWWTAAKLSLLIPVLHAISVAYRELGELTPSEFFHATRNTTIWPRANRTSSGSATHAG